MNPHLHNAADLEKIAKLEAELEPFRGKASGKTCAECNDNIGLGSLLRAHALRLHARAEKAEAEVERLNRHLRYHYPHPELACQFERGGRESGGPGANAPRSNDSRESGGAETHLESGSPAADPAARKERDDG